MPNPAAAFVGGKFGGPFDIGLQLLDNATAATTEGLWLPTQFAKVGTVELAGSMSTVSVSLVGTNQLLAPLNQYTLTIASTVATGDVITVKATNSNILGGSASVSYTTIAGDTTTTIAAGLAALINASAGTRGMAAAGITASSTAAVITVSFPSVFPNAGTENYNYATNVGAGNITTFAGTSTGSETVTVAGVTTIGSAIGSAITALGLTSITLLTRWTRARMTTLTGANAFINATFCGSA